MNRKRSAVILSILCFACFCMGLVDAVIQPGYLLKSGIKLVLFLGLPLVYQLLLQDTLRDLFKPRKGNLLPAVGLGAVLYCLVLGAYLIFRNVFDFSELTGALEKGTGVTAANFLPVALYISFVNSFLEEFFFRGFGFLQLQKFIGSKYACVISAALFALYHIAMMIGWFALPVVLLVLAGLFVGGLIFNWIDSRCGGIYLSWLVHMFTNFATNTIGFLLFLGI